MSRIQYVIGDATDPQGPGVKIIAHCISNTGAHDAGFALALTNKWPILRRWVRSMHRAANDGPGEIIEYWPTEEIAVLAIVGQNGLGRGSLRHNWLGAGLHNLAHLAIMLNASVHMPRIGCGLAGGKWEDVEPLILAAFNTPLASFVPVTVYDLPK